jgi:hypothetical protein
LITGFIKPILLIPSTDISDEDLKIIFTHELIHYKRKDIWYKLLLVFANAFHWFNPIIYKMSVESNKDIEMVCDTEVITNGDIEFRKHYSETILSMIHKEHIRYTSFSTYFYGGLKTMKQRIFNIFDMTKKRSGIITLCIILLLAAFLSTAIVFGSPITKDHESDNPQTQDASIIPIISSVVTSSTLASPIIQPTYSTIDNESYIEFDQSKYNYAEIDNKILANQPLTRFEYFAALMREQNRSTNYSYDSIIVRFNTDSNTFLKPNILSDAGLDIGYKVRYIQSSNVYWTTVGLSNKTRDGIKDAIIILFLDDNVNEVILNYYFTDS